MYSTHLDSDVSMIQTSDYWWTFQVQNALPLISLGVGKCTSMCACQIWLLNKIHSCA